MIIKQRNNLLYITETDFCAQKTFLCGQCFRFEQTKSSGKEPNIENEFIGVAFGRVLKVIQNAETLSITSSPDDFELIWRPFLDLDRDYNAISHSFSCGELGQNTFMTEACEFSRGLHILAQDSWEALCSFIFSQCNNIPRIKQNIESLCRLAGTALKFEGKTYYSFPHFSVVAALKEKDLAPVRCGYRAPYIIAAARFLQDNPDFFDNLRLLTTESAIKQLTSLSGIGKKVANCFLLFGLQKYDAFPVDTWMKKAEERWFDGSLNSASFGQYAGLAQQYIFYYAKSGGL